MTTLREVRLATGLGRPRFARLIGKHGEGDVLRYENGVRRPNVPCTLRIVEALGLSAGAAWEIDELRPSLELAALDGLIERPVAGSIGTVEKTT